MKTKRNLSESDLGNKVIEFSQNSQKNPKNFTPKWRNFGLRFIPVKEKLCVFAVLNFICSEILGLQ